MRKSIYFWLLLLAASLLFTGCKGGGEGEGDGPFLYYVNAEGTELVKQETDRLDSETESAVEDMLEDLQKTVDAIDYKSAFPQGVAVEEWSLEQGVVKLHFTESYEEMEKAAEVLLKAAVVQSLTQIEGVESVEFYIGDQPLTRKDGTVEGPVTANDFVQITGSSLHSYQVKDFGLFFA